METTIQATAIKKGYVLSDVEEFIKDEYSYQHF